MSQNFDIKYLPTQTIFSLPKEECDRLISESGHNYVVMDEDYEPPATKKPEKKSTILDSILDTGKPKVTEKPISNMNKTELLEYCHKHSIPCDEKMNKKDLVFCIREKLN